jgi:heme exporter protein D
MNLMWTWLAIGLTVAALVIYEVLLVLLQRRRAGHLARVQHARLREAWLLAVTEQKGSEVLAVQTLRNALMSATMLASTTALALMGTVTLAAPSLQSRHIAAQDGPGVDPQLVLALVLLGLLCVSLIAAVMAVRYYNHAGFIGGMPVGSDTRRQWTAVGTHYVRRAGMLYGIGLRQLVLAVPIVTALLQPMAGPIAAIIIVGVLFFFDRYRGPEPQV